MPSAGIPIGDTDGLLRCVRRRGSALLILAALSLLWAPPATAGWDAGLAAYETADFSAAMREWQPLAEQGDARAQEMLGYMYDLGEGVPENDGVAAAWYLRAANQGSADARINLGLLYATGSGVPRDALRAYMWFELAALSDDPALGEMARQARAEIARRMTPDEIAQARDMARRWGE
jgi:TPR repeat protein